jgi:ABC-type glycerol-3-phosphate transport system substrate-binding protein
MILQRLAYIGLGLLAGLVIAEQAYVARLQRPLARPVVRIGCAGWQKSEMPFESFIAAYEQLHPDVDIQLKVMPPEDQNKLMMLWLEGRTPLDAVLGLANEEIYTYIQMGVLEDVQNLLTPEQVAEFLPASLDGSSVVGRDGRLHRYMIPFTVEMMCLNVREDLLAKQGITKLPATYVELEEMAGRLGDLRDTTGRKIWPVCADFSQYVFFGQNCYVPMLADYTSGQIADARGRLDIASPQAARVFITLRRWFQEGMVSNSATVNQQADRDFQAGLGVVYPHWQSRGPLVEQELRKVDPNVKVAIYPAPGADRAGSLVSSYGAIIPACSPNKKVAAEVAYELLSHWIQPAVVAVAKLPPIKSVYEAGGFDRNPDWLRQLRALYAGPPADGCLGPPANQRPDWLKEVEKVYADASLPDWMRRLEPSLFKGYTFPDVTMWGKVWPALAITFQEWLDGKYGEDVNAAMKVLQQRVDTEYERSDNVLRCLAVRREG